MSNPLSEHVLNYIELNSDPSLPFSDVLDVAIQRAKQVVRQQFAAYEQIAEKRRPVPVLHAGPQ